MGGIRMATLEKAALVVIAFIAVVTIIAFNLFAHFVSISYGSALIVIAILSYVFATLVAPEERSVTIVKITLLTVMIRVLMAVLVYWALPLYGPTGSPSAAQGFLFGGSDNFTEPAWRIATQWIEDGTALPIFERGVENYPLTVYFGVFVYRLFGPNQHLPLLFTIFLCLVGGLTATFTYKAAWLIGGYLLAWLSALWVALQPEFIVWSVSPYRDPFIMMFVAVTVWGMALAKTGRMGNAAMVLFIGVTGILAAHGQQGILWMMLGVSYYGWQVYLRKRNVLLLVALSVLVLTSVSIMSSRVWRAELDLRKYLTLEVFISQQSDRFAETRDKYADAPQISRQLIRAAPLPLRIPMVSAWGFITPLPGNGPFWSNVVYQILMTLRGLGWHAMLPFLVYGLVCVVTRRPRSSLLIVLAGAAVIVNVVSALQDWGDVWDSARYRSSVACIYGLLAGLACVHWRQTRSSWMPTLLVFTMVANVGFALSYALRALPIHSGVVMQGVLVGMLLVGGLFAVGRGISRQTSRRRVSDRI